ncbi:MAG: hypothetical protein KDA87_03405 [Planctomycetales bacterium]|nr:hypothetical protein [Planctomycetales bacterium]
MSKCDVRIVFDKPDRTYHGGETVSGKVLVSVNQNVNAKGIRLTYQWRTHGRGNRATGDKQVLMLSEASQLTTGDDLVLPFQFTADEFPFTYRGHYLNIDHYVKADVDVAWAFNPKSEQEIIVLPGKRPAVFPASRTEVRLKEKPTKSNVGGAIGITIVGIVLLVFSFVFIFLLPFVLLGFVIYFIRKQMLAAKIREAKFTVPHLVVAPNEPWSFEFEFVPKSSFSVNEITMILIGQERVISGSGTDRTTHRHKIHESVIQLHPAGQVPAKPFRIAKTIPFPETTAYSFEASDNYLEWEARIRIDIPMSPDWKETKKLQVIPLPFAADLSGNMPATVTDLAEVVEMQEARLVEPAEPIDAVDLPATSAWQTNQTGSVANSAGHDNSPVTSEPANPFAPHQNTSSASTEFGSLSAIIQQLANRSTFGSDQRRILDEISQQTFPAEVETLRVVTTLSYFDDDRYNTGKTLSGKLLGTESEVRIFFPEQMNKTLDSLEPGHTWKGAVRIHKWDSLYRRLELFAE